MEDELKKWTEYLFFIKSSRVKHCKLTQYQKEDISFAKRKVKELGEYLNESDRKERK